MPKVPPIFIYVFPLHQKHEATCFASEGSWRTIAGREEALRLGVGEKAARLSGLAAELSAFPKDALFPLRAKGLSAAVPRARVCTALSLTRCRLASTSDDISPMASSRDAIRWR